jgi:hypothetical protein
LYPAEFRHEYGTEMRRALRERCRDAVREQRAVAGFVLGELLPDLCNSIWEEQSMAYYQSPPRRAWILAGGLLVALLALVFANAVGRWYWDNYNPQRVAFEKYESVQAEERPHAQPFIDHLATSGQPALQAAAAYLDVAGMETGANGFSSTQRQTLRATAQRIKALAQARPDAFTLAILARACQLDQDCDATALARRFLQLQPDNADAWNLAFTAALKAKDAPGIRAAIAGFANAQSADFDDGRFVHLLLQQAVAFAPADDRLLRTLASRVNYQDWLQAVPAYRLRNYCDPGTIGDDATWREDCGRIANRLAHSKNIIANVSGTILQYRLAAAPERAALLAEYRKRIWLRTRYGEMIGAVSLYNYGDATVFDKYDADTLAAGKRWQAAWANAGDETQALQQWLAMQGAPTAAPKDFQLTEIDRQRLSNRSFESFTIAL